MKAKCIGFNRVSKYLTLFVRCPNATGYQRVKNSLLPQNTKHMTHLARLCERNALHNDPLKETIPAR